MRIPPAGWYPDPAGTAGRFRYWDGQQWSAETTDDPRHPHRRAGRPGPGAVGGSSLRPSRSWLSSSLWRR